MVTAPGADDNGTGTTTVLTAAEILTQHQFEYSIRYICFAGEENGLRGSYDFATWAAAQDLGIVGVLNFDMMGYWTPGVPFDLEIDTSLYWVQGLRSQPVSDYTRLDVRLGWRPLEQLELSLVGQNLTESRHEEFEKGLFSLRSQVPRSVYAKVTWRR